MHRNDELDDFFEALNGETSSLNENSVAPKSIIKWVGGKAQLLAQIRALLPKKCKRYHEPFIGGGAVFFDVAHNRRFEHAHINDWNPELTNLYMVVRDQPNAFIAELQRRETEYNTAPDKQVYYLALRAESSWDCAVKQAARTVTLNKTCFNGLYRQNKKGQFNVPWGKREKVKLFEEDNIRACSQHLQGVHISNGDFAVACEDAEAGDVVYMDPPYIPHSETSNFTNYTSNGFTMDDQRRVAELAKSLAKRGVWVLLSNNDVPEIAQLYEGMTIHRVEARRSVNSKGDKRGVVGEVLIVG